MGWRGRVDAVTRRPRVDGGWQGRRGGLVSSIRAYVREGARPRAEFAKEGKPPGDCAIRAPSVSEGHVSPSLTVGALIAHQHDGEAASGLSVRQRRRDAAIS